MLQLDFLGGRLAGQTRIVHRFPCAIGRASTAQIRCEEPGVWESHLRLSWNPADGILLERHPEAGATVNGSSFDKARLRGGDLVEFGAVKVRIWLSRTRQAEYRWRERLTWIGLGLLPILQISLVYALSR